MKYNALYSRCSTSCIVWEFKKRFYIRFIFSEVKNALQDAERRTLVRESCLLFVEKRRRERALCKSHTLAGSLCECSASLTELSPFSKWMQRTESSTQCVSSGGVRPVYTEGVSWTDRLVRVCSAHTDRLKDEWNREGAHTWSRKAQVNGLAVVSENRLPHLLSNRFFRLAILAWCAMASIGLFW